MQPFFLMSHNCKSESQDAQTLLLKFKKNLKLVMQMKYTAT